MSEIRGFYALQVKSPVSANAQALWNYLMYRANAAWWCMPLIIRNDELQGALGLKLSALKRARGELVDGKFLVIESQGGNKPSHYYLMSCIRPGEALQPNVRLK